MGLKMYAQCLTHSGYPKLESWARIRAAVNVCIFQRNKIFNCLKGFNWGPFAIFSSKWHYLKPTLALVVTESLRCQEEAVFFVDLVGISFTQQQQQRRQQLFLFFFTACCWPGFFNILTAEATFFYFFLEKSKAEYETWYHRPAYKPGKKNDHTSSQIQKWSHWLLKLGFNFIGMLGKVYYPVETFHCYDWALLIFL